MASQQRPVRPAVKTGDAAIGGTQQGPVGLACERIGKEPAQVVPGLGMPPVFQQLVQGQRQARLPHRRLVVVAQQGIAQLQAAEQPLRLAFALRRHLPLRAQRCQTGPPTARPSRSNR